MNKIDSFGLFVKKTTPPYGHPSLVRRGVCSDYKLHQAASSPFQKEGSAKPGVVLNGKNLSNLKGEIAIKKCDYMVSSCKVFILTPIGGLCML